MGVSSISHIHKLVPDLPKKSSRILVTPTKEMASSKRHSLLSWPMDLTMGSYSG